MQSQPITERRRDPFFDNARFILVALVVLGHLISPFRDQNDLIFFANNFLASFRMPALILLTGYFTKRFYQDKNRFKRQAFLTILIPYLLFQTFYSGMDAIGSGTLVVDLLSPSYGMWFLLSLFTWNVLLFFFTKLKRPILVSFVIAIGIGWIEQAGHFLSISRTFVFFPLFLMGHYSTPENFEWLKRRRAKIVALLSMAGSWLLLFSFPFYDARNALLAKYSYIEIGDSAMEGAVVRLVFYVIMFLGILSFLPWMPKNQTFFTHLGRRTAYIYILHLFVMKIFYALGLFSHELNAWTLFAIPVIWVVIVFLVSSNQIVFLTKPFIEGKIAIPLLNKAILPMKSLSKPLRPEQKK
ncbi:acyltransferase family protein [Planococcus lenghuensis]|uniref:Acyltransferase 3 domain-containing protein n=1 Tax=Planococcus lenghuensis TaxID=2213202 RepID=A0A1Q2L4X0_9BACL|nr:acyltransferase family protein [Planococcus lenghuensis]AQQ55463.1 hypothetical protein B0X71_20120 [Planococcus lenghuensis]